MGLFRVKMKKNEKNEEKIQKKFANILQFPKKAIPLHRN